MANQVERAAAFRALHVKGKPLLLVNVWDAASAKVVAAEGAPALATSSGAVAAALGYADGQKLPLAEVHALVKRVAAASDLPLTVDFEAGYADSPEETARNVVELVKLGAVGINLEDGLSSAGPGLVPVEAHAAKIRAIRAAVKAIGSDVFVNVRIDTFLRKFSDGQPRIDETLVRAKAYTAAGGDGMFVPLCNDLPTLTVLAKAIEKPMNAMVVPGFPSVQELSAAGMARISLGAWSMRDAYEHLRGVTRTIAKTGVLAKLSAEA
jgi:2-methylisocitrate lyase-like PEP mutase family enzyme